MTLSGLLISAWQQTLVDGLDRVYLDGTAYEVARTRAKGLRFLTFAHGDQAIEGIEQNPETKSNWAHLAREGKRIMQFRVRGRYIANVCEGTLLRYPAWKSMGLPE